MKKIILIVTTLIIVMACNQEKTAINVNKTTEYYKLLAEYPFHKEKRLKDSLNAAFARDSLLLGVGIEAGKEVKLANGAVFYLKHDNRKLEVEMLLEKNNLKDRQFFDEMTSKVKNALN